MQSKFFDAEHTDEGDFVFRVHAPQFLDDETRGHLLEARKDVLKAMRSVIDAALSATENRDPDRPNRRQKVDIE
jgi:hypothetical protein